MTGYSTGASVKNRFYATLNKWIKEVSKLKGPNATGEGRVNYLVATGIKNHSEKDVEVLINDYMEIFETGRKINTGKQNTKFAKPGTKINTPQAIQGLADIKQQGIDLIEGSHIIEAKKGKYDAEADQINCASRTILMEQLKFATTERRSATDMEDTEMVIFWREQEDKIKSELKGSFNK